MRLLQALRLQLAIDWYFRFCVVVVAGLYVALFFEKSNELSDLLICLFAVVAVIVYLWVAEAVSYTQTIMVEGAYDDAFTQLLSAFRARGDHTILRQRSSQGRGRIIIAAEPPSRWGIRNVLIIDLRRLTEQVTQVTISARPNHLGRWPLPAPSLLQHNMERVEMTTNLLKEQASGRWNA